MALWPWYNSFLTLRKTVFAEELVLYRYVINNRLTSVTLISKDDDVYLVKQINAASAAYLATKNAIVPTKTFIFQGNHYFGICLSGIVKDIKNVPDIDVYIALLNVQINSALLQSF